MVTVQIKIELELDIDIEIDTLMEQTLRDALAEEVNTYQRRGFIVPYAQTNFENDFNMTAAYLKTSSLQNNTKKAMRFNRLNKKFKLVKQFYKNL